MSAAHPEDKKGLFLPSKTALPVALPAVSPPGTGALGTQEARLKTLPEFQSSIVKMAAPAMAGGRSAFLTF